MITLRAATRLILLALLGTALLVPSPSIFADPPGPAMLGGKKVLTLIGRDPPGVRCNNNMQVAAEIANTYKIPVQIIPQALAGPGAKAPAVYFGNDLIAVDGGEWNGMVSYTQLADILEMDGVAKHAQTGRLTEAPVKSHFDTLKSAIKDVK